MTVDVRHNEAQHRFEASVEGGVAHCDYQRRGNVLRLHHTEVPPEAEGRGVASALVKAALAYAREHGTRIEPACSYVREYVQRHPEAHDLLADAREP
jgi:predicted GNAT family acetyltransferase